MNPNFTEFDGENHQPLPSSDQRSTPARRATDTNLEIIAHKTTRLAGEFTEFKTDIHKAIDRIERAMTYNHATLTEAMTRNAKKMEELEQRVDATISEAIASAVPEGDVDGHRRHHEALIKKAEESAEFWSKMRIELSKAGLLGFCAWALYALWNAFLLGPKK